MGTTSKTPVVEVVSSPSPSLEVAIEMLVTTYSSLDSVAQALMVNPQEVADALAKANPDTAEYVALQALAKYNKVE